MLETRGIWSLNPGLPASPCSAEMEQEDAGTYKLRPGEAEGGEKASRLGHSCRSQGGLRTETRCPSFSWSREPVWSPKGSFLGLGSEAPWCPSPLPPRWKFSSVPLVAWEKASPPKGALVLNLLHITHLMTMFIKFKFHIQQANFRLL